MKQNHESDIWSFTVIWFSTSVERLQQVFQDNSLGESAVVETAVCMCEEKKKRILNPSSQHSQKSIINRL